MSDVSKEAILSAAIKFGEKSADQAMHYALQVRDLRRGIGLTLHLLKTGKTHQAKATLERLLDENR